ncbi:Uu.00g087900.m01.CDS01 [Anthostomella pinea]|uniref:Uu.00g087900.m01.CDS01 n=1 Tax=Anthostomella pinea TaxID=933095 RepID=A0AAI8YHM4_9PEZI|nr:Uu.00g087900.m01.CDS01 [Anthostomella pinea]
MEGADTDWAYMDGNLNRRGSSYVFIGVPDGEGERVRVGSQDILDFLGIAINEARNGGLTCHTILGQACTTWNSWSVEVEFRLAPYEPRQ